MKKRLVVVAFLLGILIGLRVGVLNLAYGEETGVTTGGSAVFPATDLDQEGSTSLGKAQNGVIPDLASGKVSDHLPDLYSATVKTVEALVVILALLFILLYTAKRLFSKTIGYQGREKFIKVVASHYIGPKKIIALVEVKGQNLVVGITSQGISLLSRLDEPRPPEGLDPPERSAAGVSPGGKVNGHLKSEGLTLQQEPLHLKTMGAQATGDPTDSLPAMSSENPEACLTTAVKSIQGYIEKFRERWDR